LLTLIRRCRQLADECLDTQVAQHLLDLAAQHVQNSGNGRQLAELGLKATK
jgi:hypothetical protein